MIAATLSTAGPPLPTVDEWLARVHQGAGRTALQLVTDHMRSGGSVTDVVSGLLAPAQRRVGERWHQGRWSVPDEHAASAVVEDALGVLAAHLPAARGLQRLTLVCAEGEWHVTPARMAALTLRDAGWHVDFLGGSTPADHLRTALEHTRPHVVAVSATLPLALAGVASLVDAAHEVDLPVLVGGRALGTSDHRARMLNADGHASRVADATRMLDQWLDSPPTLSLDRSDPAWRSERRQLVEHHDDLVNASYALLERRVPAMAQFSPGQLDHTRRDLAYTLHFLETALLVEDPELFHEYTQWLRDLLEHRGVPASVLRTSLHAVADVLDDDQDLALMLVAASIEQLSHA